MRSSRNVLIVTQSPVGDCDPPAAWIGGKRHLARRICAALAATAHAAYAEPFIGMGGVFLRRRVRPPVEVMNDLSGDVVTLFRVLKRFPEALTRELRWRPAMRSEFDRLKETRDCDLLDIERAARFLYLQTLAFGGKVSGQNFGVDPLQPHNFDIRRIERRIQRLHERLAGVVIENLDWLDFIRRYDREGTLFYLDPLYWAARTTTAGACSSRATSSACPIGCARPRASSCCHQRPARAARDLRLGGHRGGEEDVLDRRRRACRH